MMIISGGFKEFNSTLTKIKIQIRLSSKYLRRLSASLESLLPNGKSKVSWNPSQSTAEFRKFWREFYRLSKNH